MANHSQLAIAELSDSEAPPFGSRYLTDESLVFEKNAWDHVPPPDDQDERIQKAIARQMRSPVSSDQKSKYNNRPSLYWDIFYRHNSGNFFKDRKWLHREFPQLERATQAEAGPKTILEIGCGAGNVVFPLLTLSKNPKLELHACDFSKNAVKVVKSHPLYSAPPLGTVHASVWDLSSATLPEGLAPGSVDIIVMIFVLSALHPNEWAQAIANVYTLLRPGGQVLLRDYGRHDLTQLRFKEGRMLDENFYVRGDGTRVYFFELGELSKLFTGSEVQVREDAPVVRTMKTVHVDDLSTPQRPLSPQAESAEKRPNEQVDATDVEEDTVFGGHFLDPSHSGSPSLPVDNTDTYETVLPIHTGPNTHVEPDERLSQVDVVDSNDAESNGSQGDLDRPEPPLDLESLFPFTNELESIPGRTPSERRDDVQNISTTVLKKSDHKRAARAAARVESTTLAPLLPSPLPSALPPHPLFSIVQLGIDRRLLVNRKRELKMYRVWMQGEFIKNGER